MKTFEPVSPESVARIGNQLADAYRTNTVGSDAFVAVEQQLSYVLEQNRRTHDLLRVEIGSQPIQSWRLEERYANQGITQHDAPLLQPGRSIRLRKPFSITGERAGLYVGTSALFIATNALAQTLSQNGRLSLSPHLDS